MKGCPEKVESKVISDRSILQFHWSASRKENSFFSFLSLSLATKRKYNWCNNAINSTQNKGIKYRNAIWNLLLLYQEDHIKANGGTQVQQHIFCEKVKMFTEMDWRDGPLIKHNFLQNQNTMIVTQVTANSVLKPIPVIGAFIRESCFSFQYSKDLLNNLTSKISPCLL